MEGPGSSMERHLEYDLGIAIAIILIIVYVPLNRYWPSPARPLLRGHSGEQLSPLPGPAQAR